MTHRDFDTELQLISLCKFSLGHLEGIGRQAGLGQTHNASNLSLQVTDDDVRFAISHPTGGGGTLGTRTRGMYLEIQECDQFYEGNPMQCNVCHDMTNFGLMCDTSLLSGGDRSDKDSSEEDGGEDEEMELSEERCFDDFLGDYVDCPEEENENKEEENEDGAVNGGDTVLFPLFEIPLMTREIESALSSSPQGELFRDIWKGLFDNPDTVPLNIGKRSNILSLFFTSLKE